MREQIHVPVLSGICWPKRKPVNPDHVSRHLTPEEAELLFGIYDCDRVWRQHHVDDLWAPVSQATGAERFEFAHTSQEPVMDAMLYEAVRKADELRKDHNGIGGVYLYLGHDGDSVCQLKDGDAKEIGKGCSGRSLLEAVQRATIDWRWRRIWKGADVIEVARLAVKRFGDSTSCIFNTANFLAALWELDGTTEFKGFDEEVSLLLAVHPRIVRLKGGAHWCILPVDREM